MAGGDLNPLGAAVPQNDSLKDRGGPSTPPPLVLSPESCLEILSCALKFICWGLLWCSSFWKSGY